MAARPAAPSIAGRQTPNPRRTQRVLTPMANAQSFCEARRLAETDCRQGADRQGIRRYPGRFRRIARGQYCLAALLRLVRGRLRETVFAAMDFA